MPQITDFEKVRRRRARRRTARNLFFLTLFAGFVILGVSAVKYVEELDLTTAFSDLKAGIVTGSGFPVSLPGGKVSRMEAAEDVILLLSDTNLYSYSATGRELLNTQHNMLGPALTTAGDRTLLYDRGGTKYAIFSKSAQVMQAESAYPIQTGDLAQSGNYALATGSNETLAKVSVYNRGGENIFNWLSTKPVVSVSLAENRDFMLVGHVDVAGGSYQSDISKFQFSIDEGAVASTTLEPDELLLWVDYRSSNFVRVLTNKRAVLMDGELRELRSFPFGSEKIDRVINRRNGWLTLVLGSYAEEKQLRIITLSDEFATLADFSIDYDLVGLRSDDTHIYLAAHDRIEIRTQHGTLEATLPVTGVHQIEPMQGMLYYTTNAEIRSLDVKAALAPKPESKKDGGSSGTDQPSGASGSSAQTSSAAPSQADSSAASSEQTDASAESSADTSTQISAESSSGSAQENG